MGHNEYEVPQDSTLNRRSSRAADSESKNVESGAAAGVGAGEGVEKQDIEGQLISGVTQQLPNDDQNGAPLEERPSKMEAHRVDGGFEAWMSVLLSASINFCGLGFTYAFGVFEAQYHIVEFPDSSASLISFIGSVNIALALSFCVFIGRAAEVYGYKIITAIGILLYVASIIGASFSTSAGQTIALQGVVNGIAQSCLFVPATAIPVPYFEKRLSVAMGVVAAASGLGGIAWSFISRRLIDAVGTWWTLRIIGLVGGVLMSPCLFLIKTPKAARKNIKSGNFRDSLSVCKLPRFYFFWIASLLTATGYNVPFFYMATYVEQRCGASKDTGALVSACLSIGILVGRCTLGLIADSKFGKFNTVLLAMSLSGVLQLALWAAPQGNLPAAYVFALLYGYFGGGYIGLMPLVLAHIFDRNKLASLTGLFFTSELPGQLAGAPIAGAILSATGGHNWVYAILFAGMTQIVGSLFGLGARLAVERRIFVTV